MAPAGTDNEYEHLHHGCARRREKVAELTPVFEQMPSEVLIRFANQHNMITTNLKDCLYAESANQGYALTYLSAGLKPMVADQEKLEPWAGIQGTALFRKHKLVATLPMKESLAVSWGVNELKGPLYTVSWNEEGKASVFLIATSSSKSVRMVSGHPVFTVKLSGTGDIIYKNNHKQLDTLQAKELVSTNSTSSLQVISERRSAPRSESAQTSCSSGCWWTGTTRIIGRRSAPTGLIITKTKWRFRWSPTFRFETSGPYSK